MNLPTSSWLVSDEVMVEPVTTCNCYHCLIFFLPGHQQLPPTWKAVWPGWWSGASATYDSLDAPAYDQEKLLNKTWQQFGDQHGGWTWYTWKGKHAKVFEAPSPK